MKKEISVGVNIHTKLLFGEINCLGSMSSQFFFQRKQVWDLNL